MEEALRVSEERFSTRLAPVEQWQREGPVELRRLHASSQVVRSAVDELPGASPLEKIKLLEVLQMDPNLQAMVKAGLSKWEDIMKANDGSVVTPRDGYAMDPNAFYRTNPPYDSQSMLKLASDQKGIPVPYMKMDHTFLPPDTKRIWPYPCL